MRNKYPGTCYRCGERVEVGQGHFEKVIGAQGWKIQHASCAIEWRGTTRKAIQIFSEPKEKSNV